MIAEAGRNPDAKEFERVRGASHAMELWLELVTLFERAHGGTPDRPLIAKVYEYARWCVNDAPRTEDASTDPFTGAMLCFYEHLARDVNVRPLIGEFMTATELCNVKSVIVYDVGDDGFDDLLAQVQTTRKFMGRR